MDFIHAQKEQGDELTGEDQVCIEATIETKISPAGLLNGVIRKKEKTDGQRFSGCPFGSLN